MKTKIIFCAGQDYAGVYRYDKFEGEVADCAWLRLAIGSLRSWPECHTLQQVQFVRGRKVVTINQARWPIGANKYEYRLTIWKDWDREVLSSVDEALEIIYRIFAPTAKRSEKIRAVA